MSDYADITSQFKVSTWGEYEFPDSPHEADWLNCIKLSIKTPAIIKKFTLSGLLRWYIDYRSGGWTSPYAYVFLEKTQRKLEYHRIADLGRARELGNEYFFNETFDLSYSEPVYSITFKYKRSKTDFDHFVYEVSIHNVRIYGKVAYMDSGVRIKANNRIYSLLATQEESPVKITVNGSIKNIQLFPADNSANSKLRIKTQNGIMAIGIKEV